MLTIVIPTYNAADNLARLLSQFTDERVIISDGISQDDTVKIAVKSGANLVLGTPSRGGQLRRGVMLSNYYNDDKGWYLFLHADCQLPENWRTLVQQHIAEHPDKAGFFRLKYDSPKLAARWVELMTAWRCMRTRFPRGWALPYGDQGLLISKKLYERSGGYPDWPLFEDVKLVESVGRLNLRPLGGSIVTSAHKYERDGFLRRGWRNLKLLRRYKKGEPVERLANHYDSTSH